jgi:hypothetical protein
MYGASKYWHTGGNRILHSGAELGSVSGVQHSVENFGYTHAPFYINGSYSIGKGNWLE